MKRLTAILLMLAMTLALIPQALALQETGYAIVTADLATDRLNLRKSPSADAESLGRFYIGTRFEITGESGEFTRVRLALGRDGEPVEYLEGYMMTKYLIRETRDANYINDIFRARAKSAGEILMSPSAGGAVITTFDSNDVFTVLADVGDDWRLVAGKATGYVRTARLNEKYVSLWRAYLKATDASGVVTMYDNESLSARVVGQFITDAAVEITSMSKNGWARVRMYGTGYSFPGDGVRAYEGCVQVKNLNINDPLCSQRVLLKPSQLFVVEATRDIAPAEIGGISQYEGQLPADGIPKGAAAIAIGYADGKSVIEYDHILYTVPMDAVTGTTRYEDYWELPITGFAFTLNDTHTYSYPREDAYKGLSIDTGSAFKVTSSALDGWYQIMDAHGFIPAKDMAYYALDELFSGTKGAFGVGEYTVGKDMKAALYTLTSGEAVVRLGDNQRAYQTIGECSFYLPAGATLTVKSGEVSAAVEALAISQENEKVENLSGRYLTGAQMVSRRHWDYHVTAARGAEKAYYTVTPLVNDDLGQSVEREEMRVELEPGETYTLTLYEGDIVEFSHCDVEVFYGNG